MSSKRKLKEVYEQIKSREHFNLRRRKSSESSHSDLVIDDDFDDNAPPPKIRQRGVPINDEPVSIVCSWGDCALCFRNYQQYIEHTGKHALAQTANDKGTFQCNFKNCYHEAKTLAYLEKHVAFHSFHDRLKNIGENVCYRLKLPKCLFTTNYEVPPIEYDYGCDWSDCGALMPTIHEFLRHINNHVFKLPVYTVKEDYIECFWRGCVGKTFPKLHKLADHIKSHTKEKVIACPTCGSMFVSKTKFSDHRKRQVPIEQLCFQCSECSKLFATERLLRDHIRSHINHFKCNLCDMTTSRPSDLAKHIRLRHLDERPFKCSLCDMSCCSKQNLEQHLATHCAEKLMACEDCDFKCRSAYALDRHCQIVHDQGVPPVYECHCCSATFKRGSHLTKHLIKKHSFKWPSGHSRFRYKEGNDGIFRLQTVRFESLEVTQEMMDFQPPVSKNIKYIIRRDHDTESDIPSFILTIDETPDEKTIETKVGSQDAAKEIIITIDDVDDDGNIIKSEVVS